MTQRPPSPIAVAGLSALACAGPVVGPLCGQAPPGPIRFKPIPPGASGIHWVHTNGMSDERHLPETVGAGCAFLDFDGDGWMDIYLVNSGPSDFFSPEEPLSNALYRNNRDGTFTDVTEAAGVEGGQFGMGVAAADYDGDGDTDLFVTSYGRNLLFRNNGDGTFEERAEEAGLASNGWYTDAVWFDYDGDQLLDLFVSGFVSYSLSESKYCGDNEAGRRHYCIPRSFRPTRCLLFRNNGDGTFRDASDESRISSVGSKSFGAVATDFNRDGAPDLFVANDTIQNFLFVNQGDGTFSEEGLLLGVAYSDSGLPRSGMGGRCGRLRRGRLAGPLRGEHRPGDVQPVQESRRPGLSGRLRRGAQGNEAPQRLGPQVLRFRQRRRPGPDPGKRPPRRHDRPLQASGDLPPAPPPVREHWERLPQRQQGGREARSRPTTPRAVLRSATTTTMATETCSSRTTGNRPFFCETTRRPATAGSACAWSRPTATPARPGPPCRGGRANLERSRYRTSGGSYLSSHDPRELLGLGAAGRAETIEIRWPSGTVDVLEDVAGGAYHKVIEGRGIEE